jgi:beta-aspartyl-peptidase (threonine type)
MSGYSLMIHGGAGVIRNPERFEPSLQRIVSAGADLLERGGTARDAVSLCVTLLEDDPLYNAGFGSVLNADGVAECDAAIMDGRDLSAGAVAGVGRIKNPILAARTVMENSAHVFLIGGGAEVFARRNNVEMVPESYFQTPERLADLARAKARNETALDHVASPGAPSAKKLGTVGAVARDRAGNLAAATSTGGMTNKLPGRVGDSPVVGAGVFADNASCAVSCTGVGEHFLRTSLARTVGFLIEDMGLETQAATDEAIRRLVEKVSGVGALIVVGRDGVCARAQSTPGLLTASARDGVINVKTA